MPKLSEIIKKIKPSVISVAFATPTFRQGEMNFNIVGSGFVISEKGYMCTCAHVVTGKQGQLNIGVKENNEYIWAVSGIVLIDNERDIAIIKLPPPPHEKKIEFKPIILGDSNSVEEGQEVAFCGFSFGGGTGGGFTPSTTRGLISALRPKKIGDTEIQHFQLDAMVTEGNSGAPVFDTETGEVIGIVNAKFDPLMIGNIPRIIVGGRPILSPTNIGFAIPINLAKQVIEAVLEKES